MKRDVEALREVAGELEVLALVLADRHVLRPVEQDVGGLQDRVGEEADARGALAALGRLVLELRHPARLAEAGEALQHPRRLRVRGHLALHEDRRPLGVDAGREELGDGDEGALAQQLRVVGHRDRVQVRDEEERIEVVLQGHPLLERAQEVAEVERVGGGLDAGEHPGPGRPGCVRRGGGHARDCAKATGGATAPPSHESWW